MNPQMPFYGLSQGYLRRNKTDYDVKDIVFSRLPSQKIKNPSIYGQCLCRFAVSQNARFSCFDIIKLHDLFCISKDIICSILTTMCQFSPSVHD